MSESRSLYPVIDEVTLSQRRIDHFGSVQNEIFDLHWDDTYFESIPWEFKFINRSDSSSGNLSKLSNGFGPKGSIFVNNSIEGHWVVVALTTESNRIEEWWQWQTKRHSNIWFILYLETGNTIKLTNRLSHIMCPNVSIGVKNSTYFRDIVTYYMINYQSEGVLRSKVCAPLANDLADNAITIVTIWSYSRHRWSSTNVARVTQRIYPFCSSVCSEG
jgi:hypothetical protein